MDVVYVLQHAYETAGTDEVKFLGVYSSQERAEAAIQRLRTLPGFSAHPDDFFVDRYELDQDHWTTGFFTDTR